MFLFDPHHETFEMFSFSHLIALIVLIACFTLMFIFRNKLKKNKKVDRYLRVIVASLMLLMEWTFYVWSISSGGFQLSLLPLGLCAMAMYLTVIMLFMNSENTFKLVYPWAITGAVLSLTIADTTFDFPHFRYLHYFGNHSLFLLSSLYFIFVKGYRIAYKDILNSSLVLFLISIAVYILNQIIHTNHLFLSELPKEVSNLYDWMGHPWWVFGFSFSIFALFNLWYLPFLGKKAHST
ncbi:MAG: TIGR02206 family membrane protein [Acholeplasmataceae bacterium]|nr:TIGR02206 family membrane protein [Acholeplasmataceae bacterium]